MNTFTVSIIQAQEENGSIVATTTTSYGGFPYQRKGFYAAGRFWAFYGDGANAVYKSSVDGDVWSDPTSIGTGKYGHMFSVWFDGTYVHYIRYNTYDLIYRRGAPENDGSITWSAVEQTAYDGIISDRYEDPCITVDSEGYAWIGARHYNGSAYMPYVLKNADNDGTWTQDFTYELNTVDDSNWGVVPIPLTNGKIYMIYCRNGQLPLGNLWNGAAWVGEENDLADYNIMFGFRFSAVALGDNVHFVYTRSATYQIRHNKRVWGVGWNAADVLIRDNVNYYCTAGLSVDLSTGDLYCFWTQSDHVYYKKYSADAWGDLVDWIDESTDGIRSAAYHSSWYQSYGNKIGVLYNTKTISPFNVKFNFITVLEPFTVSVSGHSGATGEVNSRKLVRLSDGTLYCTYFKQLVGQYQIYVKKSIDNGETWTDETRISTYEGMENYHQLFPSIAVDSDDHLHVAWRGPATGYDSGQIWHTEYTTSWATPARVSTYENMDGYSQYYPSIAVDSNDNPHVVWIGNAAGFTTRNQVWYTMYTMSWDTPVRISTYEGMEVNYQDHASIAVDSNNCPHVVWQGHATGYTIHYQIWYTKYTDTWAPPDRISTYGGMEVGYQFNPSIAIDLNDYLHVVWNGHATGYATYYQIWYAKYTDSWITPVRISTYDGMANYSQMHSSIATDLSDNLHVVWDGKANGYTDYNKVWYAKYETGWTTPKVEQATGQNKYPNVRWSRWPMGNIPTDRIDYVFTEGTISPYNIKFAYLFETKTRLFTLIETTILSDEFSSTVEGVLLFVQFTDLLVIDNIFYPWVTHPIVKVTNYAMIALLAAVAAIAIAICGIDFERKKK